MPSTTCWLANRFTSRLQEIRRTMLYLAYGVELPPEVHIGVTCGGRVCIRPLHCAVQQPVGREKK